MPEFGQSPRCSYCGGVIGVYEPAVQVLGRTVRTTSRAAEADLSASRPGRLYHAVCYELTRRPRELGGPHPQ